MCVCSVCESSYENACLRLSQRVSSCVHVSGYLVCVSVHRDPTFLGLCLFPLSSAHANVSLLLHMGGVYMNTSLSFWVCLCFCMPKEGLREGVCMCECVGVHVWTGTGVH